MCISKASQWLFALPLVISLLYTNCLVAVYADDLPPTNTFVFKAVNDQQKSINPSAIQYNFGTTTQLDDKYVTHGVEHIFVLSNTSAKAITITDLEPNSICINKNYVTNGRHDQVRQMDITDDEIFPDILPLPTTVAPGSQVSIFVSIDPSDVFSGPVTQSVNVMVQDQASPAAILIMSGTLQNGIAFSPSVLNFHEVTAGSGASLALSVTLDRRLHRHLPFSLDLRLVSNNPDILIRRTPHSHSKAEDTAAASVVVPLPSPKIIVEDFPKDSVVTYQIILSPHASLGTLKGNISIIAPQYPNIILLVNAQVPVSGEVIGDVTCWPPVVVFGSVPVGTTVTKIVTITSHKNLAQMKAFSSNPNISVRLTPKTIDKSTGTVPGRSWQLEITLGSQTPISSVEDKVSVMTPSGQHLEIPVFASVYHQ